MSLDGLWAPASVDWCEPNYVWLSWVAEAWNTGSSLPMAALGLWGAWWSSREGWRFVVAFLGLALVGVGSAAFHGTLLRGPQALDELPMIYLGLITVWCVHLRDRPASDGLGLGLAMGVFAALFSVTYALIPQYFPFFVATYAGLVTWLVVRSVHLTWRGPAQLQRLLTGSALTYLGTLSLCWIPEHVLLPCDHPLQALQLHAWWHLGAGWGTYLWIVWAVVDRRRTLGGGDSFPGQRERGPAVPVTPHP